MSFDYSNSNMAKSNKKNKKARKQQQQKAKPSPQQSFQEGLKAKSPVILFLVGFAVCVIVFYLFYYSSWYEENLRDGLLAFQAKLGGGLINLFGYGVQVNNGIISGNDFAMSIKNGCDGLEATVLFLSAVLMFPIAFKLKIPGLLLGFGILFIANLIRIMGLYMIGVHWNSAFEFFHLHGGLVLFMFFALSIWLLWIDWAYKKEKKYATH